MKRLRIGIDLDGVVCSFTTAACDFFREKFGKDVHPIAQTSWDFSSLGITQKEEDIFWAHVHSTPNWWTTLPREDGTYRLGEVCKNHDVFFITNRRQESVGLPIQDQSAYWLRDEHHISFPCVIAVKKKGPVVAALDLDYFIDDKDRNLEEIAASSQTCVLHVKHQPYNLHITHLPRQKTLNDFLMEIGACQLNETQPATYLELLARKMTSVSYE
jgi:uncharacterized HAD superfamily protein